MDYNSPENLAACFAIVEQASRLLYYSHIPTSIAALLIGCFVLFKNKASLISKILFALSLSFALWTTADLVVWFNYDKNTLLMFAWSFFGILYSLIYILSLYFVYVFIDKKDISLKLKMIFGFLLLPILLLTPTKFNLKYYNTVDCIAADGKYFSNYYYLLGLLIFLWIIIFSFLRYRKAEKENKKQIILLAIGIGLFLFSFFSVGFLLNYLVNNGYIAGGDYGMEQYGLFGMPIFLAFLAYLIVKFKAFNTKLLGAQALVAALVILVSAELFFAESATNQILILITMALSLGFGYILIKSVKAEVERKEQLQEMSDSLASANDRLKKLDNAKSEFISIASHQLRTPLTSIKGYISLITEGTYGTVSAEVKDALSRVYLSNERLIKLVENLLNVSRIESGRMEYAWEKGNVEGIISGLLDDFIFAAKKNGLYLNAKLPDQPLPQVRMDKAKLTEVISNTIDNAIKYTKKGGVTVQASLEQFPISNNQFPNKLQISNSNFQNKNRGVVRVTVSDTGIGIPAENMGEMFQKFSRGKDTTRLHATGTGLGMFVAKNIIEAHQGRIWAESDGENKGSRFIIELPVG